MGLLLSFQKWKYRGLVAKAEQPEKETDWEIASNILSIKCPKPQYTFD